MSVLDGGVLGGVGAPSSGAQGYDTYTAALSGLSELGDGDFARVKDAVLVRHSDGLVAHSAGRTQTHPNYLADDGAFVMRLSSVLADLSAKSGYTLQGGATVAKVAGGALTVVGANVGSDGVVLGQLTAPGGSANLWTISLVTVPADVSLFFRHGSVQAELAIRTGVWNGITISNGSSVIVYGDGSDFHVFVVGKGTTLPGYSGSLSTGATGIADRALQIKVNGTIEIDTIEIRRV